VALAALGARTRAGGYFTLLAVLVLPELLAPWTAPFLPASVRELTSIPAALEAVRQGIAGPASGALHALCALAGLSLVAVASSVAIQARLPEDDPGGA
jgi:hypothetical protein